MRSMVVAKVGKRCPALDQRDHIDSSWRILVTRMKHGL